MNWKIILLTLTLASSAMSDRVKRQSALQEGMKMFESLRGDMQKGFNSLMGRIMQRGSIRGLLRPRRPQPILPPNLGPPPNQIHTVFHQPHVAPVPKTPSTSSSFAVFHGDRFVTPSPFQVDVLRSQVSHLGAHSAPLPIQQHVKIQDFHNRNQENDLPDRIHSTEEKPSKKDHSLNSFVGSIEAPPNQIPKTSDGWIALPPPFSSNTPRVVQAQKMKADDHFEDQDNKLGSKEHKQLVSAFQLPKLRNSKGIAISSGIKLHESNHESKLPNFQTKLPNNGRFVGQKQLPAQKSVPVFREDIKHPLHSKPSLGVSLRQNKSPFLQQLHRNKNYVRNKKSKIPSDARRLSDPKLKETLIDRGLNIQLSDNQETEKKPKVYEFGYGVEDTNSGNRFYHSEKKEGKLTKGSYKVHLPDGRIQTVDYRADEKGYQPRISFQEKAVHPPNKSLQLPQKP